MMHALTIDLEEFFQIHALSGIVSVNSWETFGSSVQANTEKIIDLLDEASLSATFFCLGWIAERNRDLIRTIHSRGHEIACHGYLHQLISTQDPRSFRTDVSRAKNILEDCIGEKVIGYRAPTYSITSDTLWALDVLEELGFSYDSSIFPIYHDNYGIPDAPRHPHRLPGRSLVEFPLSTLKLGRLNIPVSGGGYFRLLPYPLTHLALRHLERKKEPFIFYIHPWEINKETPRISGMPALSRFRTYVGIDRSYGRFRRLVRDFPFGTVRSVLCSHGFLEPSTGRSPQPVIVA